MPNTRSSQRGRRVISWSTSAPPGASSALQAAPACAATSRVAWTTFEATTTSARPAGCPARGLAFHVEGGVAQRSPSPRSAFAMPTNSGETSVKVYDTARRAGVAALRASRPPVPPPTSSMRSSRPAGNVRAAAATASAVRALNSRHDGASPIERRHHADAVAREEHVRRVTPAREDVGEPEPAPLDDVEHAGVQPGRATRKRLASAIGSAAGGRPSRTRKASP